MNIKVYTTCIALFVLSFYSATVNSASESNDSKNAIAKVIKVTPSIDNEWIVAVTDVESPSGYAVKVKKYIEVNYVKNNFVIFMYSRTSPKGKLKDFFAGRMCSLLDPNDKSYPKKDFMPRQIIDLILPGRYGSCNLENSTVPIKASGTVSTDSKTNKQVSFPESTPFELVVNVLSMKYIYSPEKDYFFQVVLNVGGDS